MQAGRWCTVLFAVAGAALLAAPVTADWLVLRGGGAIETDGPWQVKGKLLVFHRTDGSLASMRLAEVDLERSRQRTEAAAVPRSETEPTAARKPERQVTPVLVLTDADVGHVTPTAAAEPGLEPGDSPEDAEVGDGASTRDGRAEEMGAVEVADWHEIDDTDFAGVKIGGTIVNGSEHVALNIVLHAQLTDEDGTVVGRSRARVFRGALQPGDSTGFEVEFSGLYMYTGIDFELQSFDAVRRLAEE